jgi:Cys-Gly metallodipeptidase DUG1
MQPNDVDELVFKFVKEEFAKLGSKNTLEVSLQHSGKWWVANPKHWNYSAASKAAEHVWGVKPDLTREGGRFAFHLDDIGMANANHLHSIPITLTFEEATGKNVLLLPMGSSTDGAHSTNGTALKFFALGSLLIIPLRKA